MRFATLAFSLTALLAGCGEQHPAAVSEKPVPFAVPVAVGCVGSEGRPAPVQTLKERYTDAQWAAMPPGAKAQAGAAQGGAHLNYEGSLRASTAGCR
jgi:hypothetical protein